MEKKYDGGDVMKQINISPIKETIQTIEAGETTQYCEQQEIAPKKIDASPSLPNKVNIQESAPSINNEIPNFNHGLLNGRDNANQHPIQAITGLRQELDDIKALKTVESNSRNHADYYAWLQDESHSLPAQPYGYFVSMGTQEKIRICNGIDNIFGVTVESAGFIGGQSQISRNEDYGLVACSGIVAVKCAEVDINVGDYVVSDDNGMAIKSTDNYGYYVCAISDTGIRYAIIILDVSSNQIKDLALKSNATDIRSRNTEENLVAISNVANEAYALANSHNKLIDRVSSELVEKVTQAIEQSDDATNMVSECLSAIQEANSVAAQARLIAEGSVVTANGIRQEVISDTQRALLQSKQSDELVNGLVYNIGKYHVGEVSPICNLSYNVAKDIMVDGMVYIPSVSHNEDFEVYQCDFTVGNAYTWNNDIWNEAANVVFFSSVYIPNGQYWIVTQDDVVYDTEVFKLGTLYARDGGKWMPVATLQGNATLSYINQQSNRISESVSTLSGQVAAIDLAVNEQESRISGIASHISGEYIAIETWDIEGKDTDKVYYVSSDDQYWYYEDDTWHCVDSIHETPIKHSLSAIEQRANQNEASITQIVQGVGENGEVTAASIVSKINTQTGDSIININANKINFESDDYTINAHRINFDASDFKLSADKIDLNGTTTFNSFLTADDLGATGQTVIDGSRIVTGSIDADRININSLSTAVANIANSLVVGQVSSAMSEFTTTENDVTVIDGSKIKTGSITADQINVDTLNSLSITANSILVKNGNDTLLNAGGGSVKIGGWTVNRNSIYKNENDDARVFFCTGSTSTTRWTVCGAARYGLVLKAGTNFGVTIDGKLYARGVNLSGYIATGNFKQSGANGEQCVSLDDNGIGVLCNKSDSTRGWIIKVDNDNGNLIAIPAQYDKDNKGWKYKDSDKKILATYSAPSSGSSVHNIGTEGFRSAAITQTTITD